MPNMFYCRAENTLADLQQILDDVVYDGLLETFQESSREEKAAAVALVDACSHYIKLFEYAIDQRDAHLSYDDVFNRVPRCIENEA